MAPALVAAKEVSLRVGTATLLLCKPQGGVQVVLEAFSKSICCLKIVTSFTTTRQHLTTAQQTADSTVSTAPSAGVHEYIVVQQDISTHRPKTHRVAMLGGQK